MATERPILFTPDNVRAILAGTKTQTRRVVKPQPQPDTWNDEPCISWQQRKRSKWFAWDRGSGMQFDPSIANVCPYGAPGDVLWVREAWALVPATAYRASDVVQTVSPDDAHDAAIYKAGWPLSPPSVSWRPSIFMPRWAARLTLRITEVRVERVQDISEADAWAEGVKPAVSIIIPHDAGRRAYAALWDSINGKKYPWASNPWVWAITFEVLK